MKLNDTITIRVSDEERDRIQQIAEEQDRPVSYIVRMIIKQYLTMLGK